MLALGFRKARQFAHYPILAGSTMAHTKTPREVTPILETPFLPYDMEGSIQAEISWLPLRYDRVGAGSYMMRMQPGAVTIPHTTKVKPPSLSGSSTFIKSNIFKASNFSI